MILSLIVLDNQTSDNILYHHTVDSIPFTSLASISDKIHTPKPILQIACNQLQVVREHENINTQENE